MSRIGAKKTRSDNKHIPKWKLKTLKRREVVEEVKIRINRGEDVNKVDKSTEEAPIHVAAETGNLDILKLLVDAGADVNHKKNLMAETPLFFAKDSETVKKLIELGADVHLRNVSSFHLLHHAVLKNKLSIVKYLIESCGVDVNISDYGSYFTPLHHACSSSYGHKRFDLGILKFLVKNNANVKALNFRKEFPLMTFLSSNYRKQQDNETMKFYKFLLKYSDISYFSSLYIQTIIKLIGKNLFELYLEHVSILLSLGVTIYSHFEFINRRTDCREYFENCTSELLVAKSTKIGNSWVTYYHLLVDFNRKLKNYAGNEDLVKDFKNTDFSNKFSIFGSQMQEKMDKAIKRRELYDKSCIFLSNNLPIFNPNHLIVRNVLDCICNSKDLSKLCNK